MIVSGFVEPITKELPLEYAVEMNRLIQLQMEGLGRTLARKLIGAERTDFIGVPVTDRERAVEFYGETLGLKRNPLAHEEWPEFETGNVTILLNTPEQTGVPFSPSNTAIALRVPDVGRGDGRARGRGRRVPAGEPYDSGVCHMAFFKDPDGNSLILHHRHARTPTARRRSHAGRARRLRVGPDAGPPAGEAVLRRDARARGRDRGRRGHGAPLRPGDARRLRPVEHRPAVRALAGGPRAARPRRRRRARRSSRRRASSSTATRSSPASASRPGSRIRTGTR